MTTRGQTTPVPKRHSCFCEWCFMNLWTTVTLALRSYLHRKCVGGDNMPPMSNIYLLLFLPFFSPFLISTTVPSPLIATWVIPSSILCPYQSHFITTCLNHWVLEPTFPVLCRPTEFFFIPYSHNFGSYLRLDLMTREDSELLRSE